MLITSIIDSFDNMNVRYYDDKKFQHVESWDAFYRRTHYLINNIEMTKFDDSTLIGDLSTFGSSGIVGNIEWDGFTYLIMSISDSEILSHSRVSRIIYVFRTSQIKNDYIEVVELLGDNNIIPPEIAVKLLGKLHKQKLLLNRSYGLQC